MTTVKLDPKTSYSVKIGAIDVFVIQFSDVNEESVWFVESWQGAIHNPPYRVSVDGFRLVRDTGSPKDDPRFITFDEAIVEPPHSVKDAILKAIER